jgi:hypothetical protein
MLVPDFVEVAVSEPFEAERMGEPGAVTLR